MPLWDNIENPLISDSPRVWQELIDAAGPASLLVVIESRLGAALRNRMTPEDILQDALLHAWRDRMKFQWRGLRSFRSWLLSIIDHRIHDAADFAGADKRGGDRFDASLDYAASGSHADHRTGPSQMPPALLETTTPSRLAVYREQAAAMIAALQSLPDELRDVVRLRLIEQRTMEQVASDLSIGVAAARHRFRKGSELYRLRVTAVLASHSQNVPSPQTSHSLPDSAPFLPVDSSDEK